MISELKIRNFKSLESVDLKLGHFNLLVGANASGKSNFLDALRFLQGVGNGLNLEEILDGKPPSSTGVRWDGIRGGSKFVAFRNNIGMMAIDTSFQLVLTGDDDPGSTGDLIEYSFSFSADGGSPLAGVESLVFGGKQLLTFPVDGAPRKTHRAIPRSAMLAAVADIATKAALAGKDLSEVFETEQQGATVRQILYASRSLSDIQFLDPIPQELGGYSQKVERMRENGEGFASLIHQLDTNGSKAALLEWLKELRPDEVDDIYALEGLNNDFMVAIKEGNKEFRAPVLSDGTLRFIALAAAFFQLSMPKVLVIEEIEKGLHPSRLRLLLELMRSQSKRTGTQVFATTHSPTLLAWLTEEDRKTTFVCTRDAESGATKMRSLADVPNLEDLIKKNYNLDQLFEQGWLESVLHES